MLDALAFVMRRATRYWQVLIVLSLGVIFATALLSSAPLLINTVIEFGMRRTLLDAPPAEANLRFVLRADPDLARYQALHASIQDVVYGYFGARLDRVIPVGNTRWLFPWIGDELRANRRVNLCFYDRTFGMTSEGLQAYGHLVQGHWPTEQNLQDRIVQVVVGEAMAQAHGLVLGDSLALSTREDAEAPDLWIEIAGIVRADNTQDRYWFGEQSPLRSRRSAHYVDQYSVLVSPEAFFDIAVQLLSSAQVELSWQAILDPGKIVLDDIPRTRASLAILADRVPELDSHLRLETDLDHTLDAFQRKAEAIRGPLYFLTLTILVLALYYVTMDASLSLRQFGREFAVLRSRGASGWQIFRLQLFEAVLIGVIAVLCGPGLALLMTRLLVFLGPLADIREPGWLLWLPRASWLASLIGAVVCMASLLLPVPNALRRSIVAHQQAAARANRPPWWQRFYVDVFMLVASLILIWRLRIYGSILGGAPSRPRVDWLLLLSPLALLVGSAAILLRVFPALLGLASRIASRGRGLPAALALWQIARDPTHVARLVLLLTLAMALGVFSTGLNATLDRNERDQSYYTVGSDLRIDDSPWNLESLDRIPGVQSVSSTRREMGRIASQTVDGYPGFELLAVQPDSFGSVAQFRDDFAAEPMADLLDRLAAEPIVDKTLPLAPGFDGLGLWLWLPPQSRAIVHRLNVQAKLETGSHQLDAIRLRYDKEASDPESGWFYLAGEFTDDLNPQALHSLWFRNTVSAYTYRINLLVLGDLVLFDTTSSQTSVLEDFGRSEWYIYGRTTATVIQDAQEIDIEQGHTLITFANDEMRTGVWFGLQLVTGQQSNSVPALVSPAFLSVSQAQIGDRVGTWVYSEALDLLVVGTVDFFPTLYEEQAGGFAITSLDPLLTHQNRLVPQGVYGNQTFVATSPAADTDVVRSAVHNEQVIEADAVRRAIKSDPLALGLRSVTLFGYVLTAILSLAGFGTHFYMSTRQRSRTYTVLRALGLSAVQLYSILVLEQVLLILFGLALGTLLGLLLNRLTLPGLPLTLGGRPPVPPFLAQTDWRAVGGIYLALTTAFLVSLGVATTFLWRSKLHELLRVDEE